MNKKEASKIIAEYGGLEIGCFTREDEDNSVWVSAKSAVQYSAMNVKIILEKLDQYIRHAENCILSRWEAGESTPGGYRKKYDGRWYQYSPVDKTPKCNCGLDEILNGTNQEAT